MSEHRFPVEMGVNWLIVDEYVDGSVDVLFGPAERVIEEMDARRSHANAEAVDDGPAPDAQ